MSRDRAREVWSERHALRRLELQPSCPPRPWRTCMAVVAEMLGLPIVMRACGERGEQGRRLWSGYGHGHHAQGSVTRSLPTVPYSSAAKRERLRTAGCLTSAFMAVVSSNMAFMWEVLLALGYNAVHLSVAGVPGWVMKGPMPARV